jgi:hypothetical protein
MFGRIPDDHLSPVTPSQYGMSTLKFYLESILIPTVLRGPYPGRVKRALQGTLHVIPTMRMTVGVLHGLVFESRIDAGGHVVEPSHELDIIRHSASQSFKENRLKEMTRFPNVSPSSRAENQGTEYRPVAEWPLASGPIERPKTSLQRK